MLWYRRDTIEIFCDSSLKPKPKLRLKTEVKAKVNAARAVLVYASAKTDFDEGIKGFLPDESSHGRRMSRTML